MGPPVVTTDAIRERLRPSRTFPAMTTPGTHVHARSSRAWLALTALTVLASGCGPAVQSQATTAATTTVAVGADGSARTSAVADSNPDRVTNVRPLPGSVVGTTDVDLRAVLVVDEDPHDVSVTVDGVEVPATTEREANATVVTATVDDLVEGPHEVAVSATHGDQTTARSWSVTASERSLHRLAGGDRFATAVAVSKNLYGQGQASAAVLARADDFADALAGAPLATSVDGPLLLTSTDTLPAATAEELRRVLAHDAPVHLLGGPVAISQAVEDELTAAGHDVVRHAGSDRYATAGRVAEQLPASDTVVVASGTRFPDALAASVPAARDGWPVLLTATDTLPDATVEAITDLDPGAAVVVGGEVAVGGAVGRQVEDIVDDVERVSGPDRYATAAAIAARFFDTPREVTLASGRDYPDALGAATRAGGADAPLLLVDPLALPPGTSDALRSLRPASLVVHGGPVAISQDVADAAHHAIVDGPRAPRVVATVPASAESSATIAPIEVLVDRALDPDTAVASVTLDGSELPTTVRLDETGTRVVVDPLSPGDLPLDEPHDVRVVLRAADPDGAMLHHAHTFVLQDEGRTFATVIGLELVEPSAATEFVGYHQSNHEGAQQMEPNPAGPPWATMDDRGRRSGSRSAADIVADEHVEVMAPITGRVLRAGSYELYCGIYDHFIAIEPDGRPGIEVKMLHFRGLRVGPGDHVEAGQTVIGDGPRRLPFESQVDEYSTSGYGPHVHVEVVDTSIPNVPNGGSGSEDC